MQFSIEYDHKTKTNAVTYELDYVYNHVISQTAWVPDAQRIFHYWQILTTQLWAPPPPPPLKEGEGKGESGHLS